MTEIKDSFLEGMAVEKVRLDAMDRQLAAAGVSNDSWGSSVTSSSGGYIENAARPKSGAVRGK
jgi:hypothetical protein